MSSVLAGVDLSIARALFHTSKQGLVSNEFWVQQTASDGQLGPVLEGAKRRAIEQRVRQWSAGQRLELRARHLPLVSSGDDLGVLLHSDGWRGAAALPPHVVATEEGADGAESHASLVSALAHALGLDCSWLGALPPVLARQTATAVLPNMVRVRLPPGAVIERNRTDQLGTDWLVLLEEEFPVLCGAGATDEGAPTAPIDLGACGRVEHPAGAVLCLCSTVEAEGRQLAWHSLLAPDGGVVSVISRAVLREQLGEVRKAAVRRHAKQLASAAYFAPLGTPQLIALCHRAVEVDAAPHCSVETISAASLASTGRQGSAVFGAVAVGAAGPHPLVGNETEPAGNEPEPAGKPVASFLIVLRGSAIVSFTPDARSAAAGAPVLVDGRVPIRRLRPNEHYGAISVLRGQVEPHLTLSAGEDGCTLLSWAADECTSYSRPPNRGLTADRAAMHPPARGTLHTRPCPSHPPVSFTPARVLHTGPCPSHPFAGTCAACGSPAARAQQAAGAREFVVGEPLAACPRDEHPAPGHAPPANLL